MKINGYVSDIGMHEHVKVILLFHNNGILYVTFLGIKICVSRCYK